MITMTKEQFVTQLVNAVPEGSVFDNPGGGTSMIIIIGEDRLSYIRGKSRDALSNSVESVPATFTVASVPQTGDAAQPIRIAAVLLMALAGLFLIGVRATGK